MNCRKAIILFQQKMCFFNCFLKINFSGNTIKNTAICTEPEYKTAFYGIKSNKCENF